MHDNPPSSCHRHGGRPSFVKIGQALSSRPDLLPKPYLEALAVLQDRLPSYPTDTAFDVIEEELGRPARELYAEISDEPVAAASLGQVREAEDSLLALIVEGSDSNKLEP